MRTMKTTEAIVIRYAFINDKVLNIYRSLPKIIFPINIKQILHMLPNCRIMSYQKFAEINNCTINEVIMLCESKSGCTHYDIFQNRYLILYNNSTLNNNNLGRQRWTCGHELGHIMCEHMSYSLYTKLAENGFLNITDKQYELEADYFAATLLSPFPLFKPLSINSVIDVQNIFGLSDEASLYRYKQYLNWKNSRVKTAWENDMVKLYNQSNIII